MMTHELQLGRPRQGCISLPLSGLVALGAPSARRRRAPLAQAARQIGPVSLVSRAFLGLSPWPELYPSSPVFDGSLAAPNTLAHAAINGCLLVPLGSHYKERAKSRGPDNH